MKITLDYFELYATLHAATLYLQAVVNDLNNNLDTLKNAVTRCQNCGKVMDCSVCPYCGWVQR